MKPHENALKLLNSWDANAQQWFEAVRDSTIESRRLVTNQAMLDAITAQSPKRLLDVGCGEGWLMRALCEHMGEKAPEMLGVDGSQWLIDRLNALGGRGVCVTYESLIETPHPSLQQGYFDLVVANFSLLADHCVELLQALRPCLTPEGKLLVQTVHPHSVSPSAREGWREEHFESFSGNWQAMPWYFRDREGWLEVMTASGFTVESVKEPRHPHTDQPISLLMTAAC